MPASIDIDERSRIRTTGGTAAKLIWSLLAFAVGVALAYGSLLNDVRNLKESDSDTKDNIKELRHEVKSMHTTLDKIAGYLQASAPRRGGPADQRFSPTTDEDSPAKP